MELDFRPGLPTSQTINTVVKQVPQQSAEFSYLLRCIGGQGRVSSEHEIATTVSFTDRTKCDDVLIDTIKLDCDSPIFLFRSQVFWTRRIITVDACNC